MARYEERTEENRILCLAIEHLLQRGYTMVGMATAIGYAGTTAKTILSKVLNDGAELRLAPARRLIRLAHREGHEAGAYAFMASGVITPDPDAHEPDGCALDELISAAVAAGRGFEAASVSSDLASLAVHADALIYAGLGIKREIKYAAAEKPRARRGGRRTLQARLASIQKARQQSSPATGPASA